MIKNLTMAPQTKPKLQLIAETEDTSEDANIEIPQKIFDKSLQVKEIYSNLAKYDLRKSFELNDFNTISYLEKIGLIDALCYSYSFGKSKDFETIANSEKHLERFKDVILSSRPFFLEIFKNANLASIELPLYKEVLSKELDNLYYGDIESLKDFVTNKDSIIIRSIVQSPEKFDLKRLFMIYLISYMKYILPARNSSDHGTKNLETLASLLPKEYVIAAMQRVAFKDSEDQPPYVRGCMYSLFVERGYLTKRTSRKIRSEQSERACYMAVETLFNPDTYSKYEHNIEEILSTFQDVRHHAVQNLIADRCPDGSVWRFVNFISPVARETLKNRMMT